jgi:biopolymer transport protein ExbD
MPRRLKMVEAGRGVDLGIIITPMLDMAFQLLAFFIMSYHPPACEGAIDGSLLPPAAGRPATQLQDSNNSSSGQMTKVRILVRAVPKNKEAGELLEPGQPKMILLELPSLQAKPIATLYEPGANPGNPPADWSAALKTLAEELAKRFNDPDTKHLELSIDADRSLRYGYFIAVREVAEASGYKKIGFNMPR